MGLVQTWKSAFLDCRVPGSQSAASSPLARWTAPVKFLWVRSHTWQHQCKLGNAWERGGEGNAFNSHTSLPLAVLMGILNYWSSSWRWREVLSFPPVMSFETKHPVNVNQNKIPPVPILKNSLPLVLCWPGPPHSLLHPSARSQPVANCSNTHCTPGL